MATTGQQEEDCSREQEKLGVGEADGAGRWLIPVLKGWAHLSPDTANNSNWIP